MFSSTINEAKQRPKLKQSVGAWVSQVQFPYLINCRDKYMHACSFNAVSVQGEKKWVPHIPEYSPGSCKVVFSAIHYSYNLYQETEQKYKIFFPLTLNMNIILAVIYQEAFNPLRLQSFSYGYGTSCI